MELGEQLLIEGMLALEPAVRRRDLTAARALATLLGEARKLDAHKEKRAAARAEREERDRRGRGGQGTPPAGSGLA